MTRRIYHPYWNWEDYKAGMWRAVSKEDAEALLEEAITFTGDAETYGEYMQRVIVEWPVACEHNLTERSMNRLAWVGHAATALAIGAPEHITRQAWAFLTTQQQDAANAKAEQAVKDWEARHAAANS